MQDKKGWISWPPEGGQNNIQPLSPTLHDMISRVCGGTIVETNCKTPPSPRIHPKVHTKSWSPPYAENRHEKIELENLKLERNADNFERDFFGPGAWNPVETRPKFLRKKSLTNSLRNSRAISENLPDQIKNSPQIRSAEPGINKPPPKSQMLKKFQKLYEIFPTSYIFRLCLHLDFRVDLRGISGTLIRVYLRARRGLVFWMEGFMIAPTSFRTNCLSQSKDRPNKRGIAEKNLHMKPIALLGNENSAQSFSDRSFWKSLGVVDVRALGSWISAPKCLLFQDLERPDRSFGPGYPREWPPDVRGISGPKTFSLGWFSVFEL